jgi:hypothetical protein
MGTMIAPNNMADVRMSDQSSGDRIERTSAIISGLANQTTKHGINHSR